MDCDSKGILEGKGPLQGPLCHAKQMGVQLVGLLPVGF